MEQKKREIEAELNEFDSEVDDEEDSPSTYECQRCDNEFTRTDRQIEDEEQSTEFCDDCLALMADAEKSDKERAEEDYD
jgi:hypothetical protein